MISHTTVRALDASESSAGKSTMALFGHSTLPFGKARPILEAFVADLLVWRAPAGVLGHPLRFLVGAVIVSSALEGLPRDPIAVPFWDCLIGFLI